MQVVCQKADAKCFLGQDRKGVLTVKITQKATTITSQVHNVTTKTAYFRSEKRGGMLTCGVVLLHEKSTPVYRRSHASPAGVFEF
jgi:hypothetical protein